MGFPKLYMVSNFHIIETILWEGISLKMIESLIVMPMTTVWSQSVHIDTREYFAEIFRTVTSILLLFLLRIWFLIILWMRFTSDLLPVDAKLDVTSSIFISEILLNRRVALIILIILLMFSLIIVFFVCAVKTRIELLTIIFLLLCWDYFLKY